MQQTSEAYKTEQKQHLREKSYVWVYLGVVDRTAQKVAQISTPVTDWSKVPTGNELVEGVYATYEQNFFRADGNMRFPPNGKWALYQGAASEALIDPNVQNSASITFAFGTTCNIRGLTLKFYDDAIPLEFTITNGKQAGTHSYVYSASDVDEHGNWSCESEFMDSTYITIIPISLKGGTQRLRIQKILFGKGFYFSDKDLLSTSFTNTVSHLSDKLPSKTFSFTIDNTSRKFSADDPHSFVHFLQEQQEVDFDYGRELPDGTIETIKGGKTYLKTWTTDEQKATFTSVGYLEFMDTTYYKGHYYSGYWATIFTLYDYAEDVFEDAGITNYSIDSSLADTQFWVTAPLPIEKHKNLLQLIANAGRCIFFEDRDGTFTIAPSLSDSESHNVGYKLDYTDLMSSPSVGTTEFVKNVVCEFYETNHGTEVSQIATIDASEGENLYFFNDPVIVDSVCYEARPTVISGDVESGIDLAPGDSITFEMNYGYYYDDYFVHELDPYDYRFRNTNKYTIEITSANGQTIYKRVDDTNTITYTNEDLDEQTNLKIHCSYNWYEYVASEEDAAYYVKFNAVRRYSNDSLNVLIFGRKININESMVSKNIGNIGVDKTCKNILINNDRWAETNRDWMADYYDDDVEYSLEYRGEPALDCDDQIYLDNNYVAGNLVRITDGTINTAQGMTKSTLKARRLSYREYAKVDIAKVDVGEIK